MTPPIFGVNAEATYQDFCQALGVSSVVGWRGYCTPTQGVPSAWPGGGLSVPSGVTTPIVSIKPNISAVLSGSLDSALAAYFALVPAGAIVTLWHEGEHSAGVSAATLIAMHAHVYPIFTAHAAAGAKYVQIFETFTAYSGSSHYPLSQWVCSAANGGTNLDGYFFDWYPDTATDLTATASVSAALTQLLSVTTSPLIGITECNYTTNVTPGQGITWTGPQGTSTPADWFAQAWAWAQANNCYCFFPFYNSTNGVPFPGADSADVLAELSLINSESGGSPSTTTYLIGKGASAVGSKTVALTPDNPSADGDAIVVCAAVVVTSETVVSVQDSQNNSYVLAENLSSQFSMAVFVATTGSGPDEPTTGLSTLDTITITYSTTGTNAKNFIAIGIPDVPVGASPDQPSVASDASSSSPSLTTPALGSSAEAIVAFITNGQSGGSISWATPWVSIASGVEQGTNAISGVASQTVFTNLPVTASGTLSASTKWGMIVIALPVITQPAPVVAPVQPGPATDSLMLGGVIEVLGNLPTTGCVAAAPSAGFILDPSYSLGAPKPIVDVVASMATDGEMPYGSRASNREPNMTLTIVADSKLELAIAEEYLLSIIDQPFWEMQWTRSDATTPVVFDCFRAAPSEPVYDLNAQNQFTAQIKLEFQGLPYARSTVLRALSFEAPLSGASAPPSAAVLDTFSGVQGNGPQWSKTTFSTAPDGNTNAAVWAQGNVQAPNYSHTAGTIADVPPWSSFAFWCAFVLPGGNTTNQIVSFFITLTDSQGNQLQFSKTQRVNGCLFIATPSWNYISIPLKQVPSGFNYTAIKKYQIQVMTTLGLLNYQNFLMTEISLKPLSTQLVSGTRGAVYQINGVLGTVHAPMAMQFQQPSMAPFSTLIAHRPGLNASPTLVPFVSVGAGLDQPDDTHFYTVSSLISGANATFQSTYTIYLVAQSFSTPASPRKVTVTIHQYPTSVASNPVSQSVSRTFTPSTDVVNGIVEIGNLTLPVADIAPDNTKAVFKVTVDDTTTSDRFLDCIFLDTLGQTTLVNTNGGDFENIWIDLPTPAHDLGRVLGSATDRNEAYSVLAVDGPPEGPVVISGGQPVLDPGTNMLFCYCVEGPPNLGAWYYPAFYLDSVI